MMKDVKRQQRRWAQAQGFTVDQFGYLDARAKNFFLPLSDEFEAALVSAGGGELEAQRGRPPKICALHSSAALAINVFAYWSGHSGQELLASLGEEGVIDKIEIEKKFPSGMKGTAPTLDVVLTCQNDTPIAVESKFTEWMAKKRPKLAHFSEKYLKPEANLWAGNGLPKCQQLAADIAADNEAFRQLDALQMLKHALGLANTLGDGFTLLYLYYDIEGPSERAALHRAEIERFASRVDACIGFRAMSYQSLFRALSQLPGIDPAYLNYLRTRYFQGC